MHIEDLAIIIVSSGRLTHSHKNAMIVHCGFIWITENNLTFLSIDQSESCRDLKSLKMN